MELSVPHRSCSHPTHRLICAQVSTDDVNTSIEENESSQSLPELDDEAPFELRALCVRGVRGAFDGVGAA